MDKIRKYSKMQHIAMKMCMLIHTFLFDTTTMFIELMMGYQMHGFIISRDMVNGILYHIIYQMITHSPDSITVAISFG